MTWGVMQNLALIFRTQYKKKATQTMVRGVESG